MLCAENNLDFDIFIQKNITFRKEILVDLTYRNKY